MNVKMFHTKEDFSVKREPNRKRRFKVRKPGRRAKEYNVRRWKKWYKNGKSTYEIAALAGVSQTTVWRKLKEVENQ